jgi:hypothetical protein
MTAVASAGEGDSQDAHGEALVLGVNYALDSFDASEDKDNGVEVESACGEALVLGVNYAHSFDAGEDEDNGVEVESARGIEHVLKVNIIREVILEPVTILYVLSRVTL